MDVCRHKTSDVSTNWLVKERLPSKTKKQPMGAVLGFDVLVKPARECKTLWIIVNQIQQGEELIGDLGINLLGPFELSIGENRFVNQLKAGFQSHGLL